MINTVITSNSNKIYKELVKIKDNKYKDGQILLEGEDLVNLAYSNNLLTKVILLEGTLNTYSNIECIYLSRNLYKDLSSYQSIPKVIGLGKFNLTESIQENKLVYLDGIQDPGNLGTIFRTCLAFNFNQIVLSKDCVSPFNFKCIQASKGSFMKLKVTYKDISELKNDGYDVYVTSLDGQDLEKIEFNSKKYVICFGNEGQGIKESTAKIATKKIYIKMNREIDSLNVGVSAGILLYKLSNIK